MKTILDFCRTMFGISAVVAVLSGCGALRQAQEDMQPPIGAPPPAYATSSRALQPLSANGYQVIYRFQGNARGQRDGYVPSSSLIAVNDTLYGTTTQGGAFHYSACGASKFFAGCGTVFEVSTSGTERVLHRFAGGRDGYFPVAGLLWLNGTLYGTTRAGGGAPCRGGGLGCGTVFALSVPGRQRVLHRFAGSPDGAVPFAGLISVNGTLYGTTERGGRSRGSCANYSCGVVFSITASGNERVVYAFRGGKDGASPSGPLVSVNGTLYGTTWSGGSGGCGTVFEVTTSGSERVVYAFKAGRDGCYPEGGVVAFKGMLYGTNVSGGDPRCDCGAVFRLSTTGKEHTIHTFKVAGDGRRPNGGLIALKGVLYGTTIQGGGGVGCGSFGCGTIYEISTSGAEQVLYAFTAGVNGAAPAAGLLAFRGTLYGTTTGGGSSYCGPSSGYGCGTVFKIVP